MNLCDSRRALRCNVVFDVFSNPVSIPNEPGAGRVVSNVPPGRKNMGRTVFPPLKRWARMERPSGTKNMEEIRDPTVETVG